MSDQQTTDWREVLITASELAAMLAPYGDRPVKLRLEFSSHHDDYITMLERSAVHLSVKSASGTEFGDLASVVRLAVRYEDNA